MDRSSVLRFWDIRVLLQAVYAEVRVRRSGADRGITLAKIAKTPGEEKNFAVRAPIPQFPNSYLGDPGDLGERYFLIFLLRRDPGRKLPSSIWNGRRERRP
jgi:hypothetical protein